MSRKRDTTAILNDLRNGDHRAADVLLPLVYDELRACAARLMRHERRDHILQPTAVVNEVYMRLVDQHRVDWQGKTHFKAVATFAMRRLLKEQARFDNCQKRGGGWQQITLDQDSTWDPEAPEVDLQVLEEALGKLANLRERTAQIVELRFFGGLTNEEIAEALRISTRTVERDWRFARAWLLNELGGAERSTGEAMP